MRLSGLNRQIDISLSWKQTEIMRGVSIVLIMLHNLLHLYPTIISECEFNYAPGLMRMFFDKLHNGSPYFVYDLISFLGWYGVPVFIFLSGYGLTRRYDASPISGGAGSQQQPFNRWLFIRRNWIKLFKLMFIGVCIFVSDQIITDLLNGEPIKWGGIFRMLIPLTELNDLVQLWAGTIPGVYWYFGLAFELYVIYALFVQGRSDRLLWIITIICFIAFLFFRKHPLLSTQIQFEAYLRHNFIGWMLPFACGIWLGRHPRQRLITIICIAAASILLFLPSLKSVYAWQLTSVFATGIIIVISLVFARIRYWSDMWRWIGRLSAYIFVAHPIARHFTRFLTFTVPDAVPTLNIIVLYTVCVFLSAIGYRYLNSILFTPGNPRKKLSGKK